MPPLPSTLSALVAANRKGLVVEGDQAWESHRSGRVAGYPLLDYAQATTFTRATEAAFVDPCPVANGGTGGYAWDFVGGSAAGNWKAPDVPRIYTDGAVLIEGARTNKYSNSNIDVGWADSNTPILVSGITAPDGTVSGVSAEDDSASLYEARTYLVTSLSAGKHTLRMFVGRDAVTNRYPGIDLIDGANVYRWVLNTSTGAVSHGGAIGLAFDSIQSTQVDGDYWAIDATWTQVGTNVTVRVYGALSTNSTGITPVAMGTSIVWGNDIQVGAFSTSPIRTAGAAATRNADYLYWASCTAAQAAALGRVAGWYCDFWPNFSSTDTTHTNPRLLAIAAGRLDVYRTGTSGGFWRVAVAGTGATAGAISWSRGDRLRLHVVASETGGAITIRAENVTTAQAGSLGSGTGTPTTWTGQRLVIGNYGNGGTTWQADAVVGRPIAK